MGVYLNSKTVYNAYREIFSGPYFVDKSLMLDEIIPRFGTGEKYICITRPRRFGKSVMANMIASFFSKGCESGEIFDRLKISGKDSYGNNLNQYNVISISFNELPGNCTGYDQYIARIEKRLKRDLIRTFPDMAFDQKDALWDILTDLYESDDTMRFVFVFDEWDFIFHRDFVTDDDKKNYIDFLSNLLKDKPYVLFAYMTGILPIAKYSSGSELNMFAEYTMASEEMFSDYFGFTESEVDDLYERYLVKQSAPQVTREGLRTWYDGYHTKAGERVYNPWPVILSLINNNPGDYGRKSYTPIRT